ncbi:Outer membrane protein V [Candidatus Rhodobacter oscarellae]|uniref:Outer membrane protein V n=1 Tax=Candidatus Rhodobacter oscarellae TaxID=1675527 RepID=A0A0J9GZR3_9RHOB|nr:MipA/OmpV family protein [Candidatus Rhodobacter lobularis]KMW58978.1 Outer membrane protein V [Candidatus Rhodobacter lobularis]
MKTWVTVFLITGAAAQAQADPARVGLGAALVPQYAGAEDYRVIVTPSFAFSLGEVEVQSRGPAVQVDLVSRRGLDAGPVLRWDGGRDPSRIDSAAVSALPEVDGTLMLGGFVELGFPVAEGTFLGPRLEALQGVSGGHDGLLVEASLGLTRLSGDWVTGARASVVYADDALMDSAFFVGAGSPSGLAAYNPGGGLRDIGLSVFASYQLSDEWSVSGALGITQLVGEAADSPIVSSKTQGVLSFGLSYTFQ